MEINGKKYFEWIDITDGFPDPEDYCLVRIKDEICGATVLSFELKVYHYVYGSIVPWQPCWHIYKDNKGNTGENVVQYMRLPCDDWYKQLD